MHSLRTGLTTGTTAAAAALAALSLLLFKKVPASVSVPLPPFTLKDGKLSPRDWVTVPVAKAKLLQPQASTPYPVPQGQAQAEVRKDAGDDPDVTNGVVIKALVRLYEQGCIKVPRENLLTSFSLLPLAPTDPLLQAFSSILITAAEGIGIATLPGLPIPQGAYAINPVPQNQIRFALHNLIQKTFFPPLPCLHITFSVENGAMLAQKTFNPRLGIVGGISILGTQGTVIPFSHKAYEATILLQLSQAKALNVQTIFLSTGRRSERLLQEQNPTEPIQAFVQAADHVAFALREAHQHSFAKLVWGCFFGKMVKVAQGLGQTHASLGSIDFAMLSALAQQKGVDGATCTQIRSSKTAAFVLEMLLKTQEGQAVLRQLHNLAVQEASHFAGQEVSVRLFHMDGRALLL